MTDTGTKYEVQSWPSEHMVSLVPKDHPNPNARWRYAITVKWRGGRVPGKEWAIIKESSQMIWIQRPPDVDNGLPEAYWSHEALNSNRPDDWYDIARWTLNDALRIAHELAPTIGCGGAYNATEYMEAFDAGKISEEEYL